MRVFKTKAFARLARREAVSDASLVQAVSEAEHGLIDADLGGGVIKQRIARVGFGKSGGYRVILAYHAKTRSLFVYLFAKNALANISTDQLTSFRDFAKIWLSAPDEIIDKALATGLFLEVKSEQVSAETITVRGKTGSREKNGQGAHRRQRRRK